MQGLVARPARCSGNRPLTGCRLLHNGRRAFTLLDVLVTITVVVILISIMLPSLGRVRETAHQVICRSNVRQIGIGISLFAEDNRNRLMPSIFVGNDPTNYKPWETPTLRVQPEPPGYVAGKWDGLGLLYHLDYLPAPRLFYCPSHHGRNAFRDYEDEWGARSTGAIVGNYQYRGRGPLASAIHGPSPVPQTFFLTEINPTSALVSDSMRSQLDFNHRVGTNVLRANISVEWYGDNSGRLVTLLPREGEAPQSMIFENLWGDLDNGP